MSGVFNVKVIVYESGLVEVRHYHTAIGAQFLDVSEFELEEMKLQGMLDDICRPEVVFNPFSEKKELIPTFDQLQLAEMRKMRSLNVSYRRTINELYKLTRQCKWEYFVTLTFSPEVVDRYDYALCMRKANKWFNNQHRYAVDLQYLFVPEQHEDGAWHIHGLLAQVDEMVFIDSGKKAKNKTIYNLGGWKFGFSTATKVDDTHKVASYITKYITKDICAVSKGKKRYYRSQNIPTPKEEDFIVEGSEYGSFIEKLEDSLGVVLDYEKTSSGFINVDYKYYIVKENEQSGTK